MKKEKKDIYFFYMDESGERRPEHHSFPGRKENWFALGGILVRDHDRTEIIDKYKVLKEKGKITYPLHSVEIRNKTKNFRGLEESDEKKDLFLKDLEEFLISIPVIGFAAVADKDGYNERYLKKHGEGRWWLCKSLYPILVERIAKYVKKNNGFLKIRFERSGEVEDDNIIDYGKKMKTIGDIFDKNNSKKYDSLTVAEYNSIILGAPIPKPKTNIFEQIADLYLFPMVKNGYENNYRPGDILISNNKIIDSIIDNNNLEKEGVKYYCFDRK